MLKDAWRWYTRLGEPLEFYTDFSPAACKKKLRSETVTWRVWSPIGFKIYRSEIRKNGSFRLKHRRRPMSPPFVGNLDAVPNGGTLVKGHVVNESSFLGFLSLVVIVAPVSGAIVHGRAGLAVGIFIALLFIAATLYARWVEGRSAYIVEMHDWLKSTLRAQPLEIEGKSSRPSLTTKANS